MPTLDDKSRYGLTNSRSLVSNRVELIHVFFQVGKENASRTHPRPVGVADTKIGCEELRNFPKPFPVSNLGELACCIGCSLLCGRDMRILYMSEEAYVDKFLEPFKATNTNPVPTCLSFERDARRENEEVTFLWVSGITRPDASHATRSFAAVSHDQCLRHGSVVLQVLANSKGTWDTGLIFPERMVERRKTPTALGAKYTRDEDSRTSV